VSNIPKLEDCKPGIKPVGFNVLVAVEPTKSVTDGGVHLPDQFKDKERLVQVRGRIVDVSPAAFDFADFGDHAPKIGDAVMFSKLAGVMPAASDGKDYRLLLDKDIAAIIDEEVFA